MTPNGLQNRNFGGLGTLLKAWGGLFTFSEIVWSHFGVNFWGILKGQISRKIFQMYVHTQLEFIFNSVYSRRVEITTLLAFWRYFERRKLLPFFKC